MSKLRKVAYGHRRMLMKTGSYYLLHIVVAAAVAYAVTGNWWVAITLSLLEPSVQAVAYFFHEKAWVSADRKAAVLAATALANHGGEVCVCRQNGLTPGSLGSQTTTA